MSQDTEVEDICKITLMDNNVVRCEFKRDFYYSVDLAWKIYDHCRQLTGGKPYLMLWIMGVRLQPQKELFDFYADVKRSIHVAAEVFCLNSAALKMMANFYFRIKKPIIISKVFDSEKKAYEWLISAVTKEDISDQTDLKNQQV